MPRETLPREMEEVKAEVSRAITPISPAPEPLNLVEYWQSATRTNAGYTLPPYYLVYFLLVRLLEFRDSVDPNSGFRRACGDFNTACPDL